MKVMAKYLNIYYEIIADIEDNKYEVGDKLPSESELMQIYKVSRDTVRKTLNLLEEKAYIQKIKGKGSIVLDINKFNFPVSGLTSFKELSDKMNLKAVTLVREFKIIEPDNYIKKQLEFKEVEKVWKVTRVREIDGQKIILDKDYIKVSIIPELTSEICSESIYKYIENELNIKIGYAKKEITVQKATEEDKWLLDLGGYDMVVVVKSYSYLEDTTLFQYTEARHVPDKFRFVDFARRTKIVK